MRKNFVLDTNVLLHDPRAMFHFDENSVVIPIYVLEEIDHFKKELSERGRNAREVARRLDEVGGTQVDQFYAEGSLPLEPNGFYANQYLLLRDRENPSHTALGRYDGPNKKVAPIKKLREGVWGIRPRNKEQHYALDLLLNDDIKLVTLVGKAGTGKTLLAIAAGLQKVVEETVYQKLLVSRPIFPLGRDIGYLPGDIEEKLNPWMQPIYANTELLLGFSKAGKKG